jgi:hypothetical protein
MTSKNNNNIIKTINPILGFGWSNSIYSSQKALIFNKIKTDSQVCIQK